MSTVPVLWLHDPAALDQAQGKSEVAWQTLMQVSRSGVKVAYIDLPHYAFLAPAPADDPGNGRLKARCITALWPSFAAEGARCVIVFSSTDGETLASQWVQAAIPGAELTYHLVEPGWQGAGDWPALSI